MNTNSPLTLLFPQWQGAGDKALHHGAIAMSNLVGELRLCKVGVSLFSKKLIRHNIFYYNPIVKQLRHAAKLIERQAPSKILTLGGDCSVEIAPVSYLNKRYAGKLAVIWFDAHGDLNCPETSPSNNFHGMPLRALLGESDDIIKRACFSFLAAKQVFLAGCRELDEPEREFVNRNHISLTKVSADMTQRLIEQISSRGYENIYIHIDLDVLDPVQFPAVLCPTPQGVSIESLKEAIIQLKQHFSVVGIGLVEYVHGSGEYIGQLNEIIECCQTGFVE